jgi:nicotinamide-nucleotide amidase
MEKGKTVYVSLPGVPMEMKNLMSASVLPMIMEKFDRPFILHRTILTYGLGESALAEKIEDWEDGLPSFIKLAYLPNLGKVRLRLSARGSDKDEVVSAVNDEVGKLYTIIGDIIYGEEEEASVEAQIASLLTEKHMTLATAESFTGGRIAEEITSIPGASQYFKGSVVSYATETKIRLLEVPEALIQEHSVVSEEVAMTMAKNVRNILNTDFAIATTGNAGPTKGDSDADVGTVYVAISTPKRTFAEKFNMGNHRERVVEKSVNKAFELLLKEILNF